MTATPRGGESIYFGRLGVILRPGHMAAVSFPAGHRDTPRITTATRLLGDVQQFDEHRAFVTRHRMRAGSEPHLTAGSLPIPMLLEYVLAAGDWVRPQTRPRQHLIEIANLHIDVGALQLPQDADLVLDIAVTGTWVDAIWELSVVVSDIARATLRYSIEKPAVVAASSSSIGPVERHRDAALWCTPNVPRACLPHAALGAILESVITQSGRESTVGTTLTIDSIVALPGCLDADTAERTAEGFALTAAGRLVMTATGLQVAGTQPQWFQRSRSVVSVGVGQ